MPGVVLPFAKKKSKAGSRGGVDSSKKVRRRRSTRALRSRARLLCAPKRTAQTDREIAESTRAYAISLYSLLSLGDPLRVHARSPPPLCSLTRALRVCSCVCLACVCVCLLRVWVWVWARSDRVTGLRRRRHASLRPARASRSGSAACAFSPRIAVANVSPSLAATTADTTRGSRPGGRSRD